MATKLGYNRISSAPDSGASPAGAEAELYTWTTPQKTVLIKNHPDSGIRMYIRINGATAADAATTKYDEVLDPGDPVFSTGVGVTDVKTVAVYFSGAGTLGTNFSVKGFE